MPDGPRDGMPDKVGDGFGCRCEYCPGIVRPGGAECGGGCVPAGVTS